VTLPADDGGLFRREVLSQARTMHLLIGELNMFFRFGLENMLSLPIKRLFLTIPTIAPEL
jgi:hypothetical protein